MVGSISPACTYVSFKSERCCDLGVESESCVVGWVGGGGKSAYMKWDRWDLALDAFRWVSRESRMHEVASDVEDLH